MNDQEDKDELRLLNSQNSNVETPLDRWDQQEEEQAPPPDPEEMLPLLTASESLKRMTAARAFCELQDDRAIPHLMQLLREPCPLIRVSAAYALGRNINSEAIDSLIEQLQQDWNGYVRKGIVWALGNCCDRRGLPPLVNALKNDISAVRLWAASSLGQLAPLEYEVVVAAVPALIEGLRKDPTPAVRSNCAWALGQLAREMPSNVVYAGVIDSLLEALEEDEDMGVGEDAKASLLRVGDPRALQIIEDLENDGFL